MSGKISLALKAGLLHDVGKVCIRATHERQRHSILGAEFIRSFLADTEADKQLLRCIKYHHGRELSGAGLDIDDLAYVIYEADNIVPVSLYFYFHGENFLFSSRLIHVKKNKTVPRPPKRH